MTQTLSPNRHSVPPSHFASVFMVPSPKFDYLLYNPDPRYWAERERAALEERAERNRVALAAELVEREAMLEVE